MFLKKRIKNNKEYWSLTESYRENCKVKHRTVKSLGNTETAYSKLLENKDYHKFLSKIRPYVTIRSPLKYFGGKFYLAKTIISLIPEDHKNYVEPFAGGANVLLQKPRSKVEVYNDLDSNVVNFFKVLKDNPGKLVKAADKLPYSRLLFNEFKQDYHDLDDKFQKALYFYYINRCSFSGGQTDITHNGWSGGNHDRPKIYHNKLKTFKAISDRLKGVYIENSPFEHILSKYDDSKTVFYIDPPYIDRGHRYYGNFQESDHRKLADILNSCRGRVILSYYDAPLVSELYKEWNELRLESYAYSQKIEKKQSFDKREELLLMNFDLGNGKKYIEDL